MDAELGAEPCTLVPSVGTLRRELGWQVVVAEGCGTLKIFQSLIDSHATLDSGNDLACLEAENPHRAPGAHLFSAQRRALGLCSIFQHDQSVLAAEIGDLVHLARKPPSVHHHQGAALSCQMTFGILQIEARRAGMDVDEHRHITKEPHGSHGSPGGVGGHQDLAALWQVEGEEQGYERARAITVSLDVLDSEIVSRRFFEFRDLVVETVVVEKFQYLTLFFIAVARPLDRRQMAIIGQRDGFRPSTESQGFGTAWLRGRFHRSDCSSRQDRAANEVSSSDSHRMLLIISKPSLPVNQV